eukprot:962459-Rhodomonas_salina.1
MTSSRLECCAAHPFTLAGRGEARRVERGRRTGSRWRRRPLPRERSLCKRAPLEANEAQVRPSVPVLPSPTALSQRSPATTATSASGASARPPGRLAGPSVLQQWTLTERETATGSSVLIKVPVESGWILERVEEAVSTVADVKSCLTRLRGIPTCTPPRCFRMPARCWHALLVATCWRPAHHALDRCLLLTLLRC